MGKEKAEPSGYVYTKKKSEWITQIECAEFYDADFFRIIMFFLVCSLADQTSAFYKPLSTYGWVDPVRKKGGLREQLLGELEKLEKIISKPDANDMKRALEDIGMAKGFPNGDHTERVCMVQTVKQENQILALFIHIRNVLAHGRIKISGAGDESVFFMEDCQYIPDKKRYVVSARMILKKSTLIKWIDIIESGMTMKA